MTQPPRPRLESLLTDEDSRPEPAPRVKRDRWDRRLDARIRAGVWTVFHEPKMGRRAGLVAGVAAIGVAVGTYFVFRPTPQPDFMTANVDVLFNYTLLTDDFNKLSIEKRLELIGELVQRLKSIDADQSLLMAAFAAQISGEVRTQFEKNASLLAVDLFDEYAEEFNPNAAQADRDRYVENTFIEFQKTLERVAGEERDISDEDRLIEGRRQAQRDLEFVQSGRMPVENTVRMITFLNNGVGQHASGHQKIRINSMITQMVKTLREGEVPPEPEKEPRQRRQREPEQTSAPETTAPTAPAAPPLEQPQTPPTDESDAPKEDEKTGLPDDAGKPEKSDDPEKKTDDPGRP